MNEKPVLYCCTVCSAWGRVQEGVTPVGVQIVTAIPGEDSRVSQAILCDACMIQFNLRVKP